MKPSTKMRRTGGRSARIRQSVHEAAISALAEKGLDRLTIEDIAARAGVSKVTIYRRWGTREKLIADALAERFADAISIPDLGSIHADLGELARRVRDVLMVPETRKIISALVAGSHHEPIDTIRGRYWKQRFAAARTIVARAVERGEIGSKVDADALLVRIVGPVWFAVFGPGLPVGDAFLDDIVDSVLASVKARR